MVITTRVWLYQLAISSNQKLDFLVIFNLGILSSACLYIYSSFHKYFNSEKNISTIFQFINSPFHQNNISSTHHIISSPIQQIDISLTDDFITSSINQLIHSYHFHSHISSVHHLNNLSFINTLTARCMV